MYEFWYDYVKPKYTEKAKFCHMDTDSLIVIIKIEDIYSDTARDDPARFDASNCELDKTLLKDKNLKKLIGLMKDRSDGKIMTEFAAIMRKI